MLKKGIGIFLAVLLLLGLLPAVVAMGAEIEHVINGSFTELANGKPTGWGLGAGSLENGFSFPLENGNVRMRLCPENIKNGVYSSQSIATIVGGETYTFSAYLRIESMEEGKKRAAIKISFAGASNASPITKYYGVDSVDENGGRITFVFTVPEGTTSVGLLVRNEATNEMDAAVKTVVYWDDISIIGAMKPKTNETDPFIEKPAGSMELLDDGGFEALTEDGKKLAYWGGVGSTSTYSISVVEGTPADGTVHGGTHAVKMKATANNPLISQRIVNPVVGATYQASFWYKIDSMYAEPGFKIEWYQTDGLGEDHYINGVWVRKAPVMSKMDEWAQYCYHFTVPENCTYLSYMVRLYTGDGEYEVTIDDASLYSIEEAPILPVKLSTDEIFYYTDIAEGTASVRLNTENFPEIAKTELTLKSETETLWSTEVHRVAGESFVIKFPLSGMIEKEDYTLEVKARDAEGNALGEAIKQKVHRYPRPTNMRADGTMLVDNKPFYPVFAYHLYKEHLSYAASIGVNVSQVQGGVTLSSIKGYLDAAHTYGIKCLVPLYADMKPAGHPDNVDSTTEIINALKDHPALLAWMVMDEATSHWPDRWDLFYASYKLIRDLDPAHAVYILQNNAAQFAEIAKYTDILAYDPYPSTRVNLARHVAKNTRIATEGVQFEKPVWSLNKAYTAEKPSGNSRPLPTAMEERHMWYQALMAGASAVGYYSYSDCITTDPPTAMHQLDPAQYDLYTGLGEFAKEELGESYAFFLEHKYPVFAEGRGENVWYSAYVKNGKIYMIVLNRHETEQTVSIPLESDGGCISVGAFTGRRVYGGTENLSGNSALNLTLEGSGAYVYEITPAETMDFSMLKGTQFHDIADAAWAGQAIRDMEALGIVTGTAPSSFMPGKFITQKEFANWLAAAVPTDSEIQARESEMTRQEMLDMCITALSAYGASPQVLSLVETALEEQLAAGTISSGGSVSRVEAAYVLSVIYEQKDMEDSGFGLYDGETRLWKYTPGTFTLHMPEGLENPIVLVGVYSETLHGTPELVVLPDIEETEDGWRVTLPEGDFRFRAFLWNERLSPHCLCMVL
ncbi:MAG: S-layer homology domain-containing protein [Clostridia bacterium]|nr:S-layer homology domain-containing protein [Clostridia bacterium]